MTRRSNYDERLLKSTLRCIAWSPWANELQCLEILVKDGEQGLWEHLKEKVVSTRLKPTNLKREGFMTDADMVRDGEWRVDPDPVELRRRLTYLNDSSVEPVDVLPPFKKEMLPSFSLECSGGMGFKLMPGSVAGIGLDASKSLIVSFEGLTVSSVPCETIKLWITGKDGAGAWVPNTQRTGFTWSTKEKAVNSIWVVTGVIYAKKYTIKGRDNLFAEVKVDVPVGGIIPVSGAVLNVHKQNDNTLVVKAPRRDKPFIVSYRAIRLDLNSDGTVCLGLGVKYSGDAFRGDDDDLEQQCLKWMETDLFEVDEEGVKASIPILTPSEADHQNELETVESQQIQQE